MTSARVVALSLAATLPGALPAAAQSPLTTEDSLLAAGIYEQLVEIPSVSGSEAAETILSATAMRLRAGGFPSEDVVIAGPDGAKVLVARFHGTGQRPPLLLLAHLDVVPALREDWSTDPFTLVLVGGDGTIGGTLTPLVEKWGSEPLPRIAVVAGGTVNTIAHSLGFFLNDNRIRSHWHH